MADRSFAVGHDGEHVTMIAGGTKFYLTHEQARELSEALDQSVIGLRVALVQRMLARRKERLGHSDVIGTSATTPEGPDA